MLYEYWALYWKDSWEEQYDTQTFWILVAVAALVVLILAFALVQPLVYFLLTAGSQSGQGEQSTQTAQATLHQAHKAAPIAYELGCYAVGFFFAFAARASARSAKSASRRKAVSPSADLDSLLREAEQALTKTNGVI